MSATSLSKGHAAALAGRGRQCGGKLRKEITPEHRSEYLKALVVWVLFTLGGWVSIPGEFLPLFSHCVGFGFFLTITTKKTRWLGAIAVGGILFMVVLYQTLPVDWISLITQSAGYTFIAVMIIIASLWKVAPTEIKDDIISTRDDMLDRGSQYLNQIKESIMNVQQGGEGSAMAALRAERADALLHGVDQSTYKTIISELDAKLMEMDHDMAGMKRSFNQTVSRITAKLDAESDARLRAERIAADKESQMEKLRAEIAGLRKVKEAQPPVESEKLRRQLQEEKQLRTQLSQNLELEKGTRLMVENNLNKAADEKCKLEKLLVAVQAKGRMSENAAETIRKTLANETNLRKRAEEDCRFHKERADILAGRLDSLKAELDEKMAHERSVYERQISVLKDANLLGSQLLGDGLDGLGVQQLTNLESLHEAGLKRVIQLKLAAVAVENERLRRANEELQDKMTCRLCMHAPIGVVLVPCGHVCMCKSCSVRVSTCPLCRKDVLDCKDIFVS